MIRKNDEYLLKEKIHSKRKEKTFSKVVLSIQNHLGSFFDCQFLIRLRFEFVESAIKYISAISISTQAQFRQNNKTTIETSERASAPVRRIRER